MLKTAKTKMIKVSNKKEKAEIYRIIIVESKLKLLADIDLFCNT